MHDLPAGVDPCGENGEYHSFVYDGPVFKEAIPFTTGEKRSRQYDRPDAAGESYTFCFCDLIPL
jgi:diphthamide synthase (EF-2-diphthine--ammonia ligase)